MFMPNYIWAFLIALFVALIATPAVIVLAARTGAMDAPDARKVHKGPMPRIGGLAIYCGFMAAIMAMLNFAELTQEVANGVIGLLLGGTLIVIIGLIDDYKNLPAKVKLLGQILAACNYRSFWRLSISGISGCASNSFLDCRPNQHRKPY